MVLQNHLCVWPRATCTAHRPELQWAGASLNSSWFLAWCCSVKKCFGCWCLSNLSLQKFHLQDKRPNTACCLAQRLENVANSAELLSLARCSSCLLFFFSFKAQPSGQRLSFSSTKLYEFDHNFFRDSWPIALYLHSAHRLFFNPKTSYIYF